MALERLKTVYFLGSLVNNIKGIFNKTNELVDAVNSLQTSTTPTYKVYTALLTQTGETAPVATVLENTLGFNIEYSYIGSGFYNTNPINASDYTKVTVFIGNNNQGLDGSWNSIETALIDTDSTCYINTGNSTSHLDSILSKTPIEIRVYN